MKLQKYLSQTEQIDDRKRSYNSMKSVEMTVEDMEAYRLRKIKREDPMASLLSSDKVLDYK